jgi:hypothetical protein
MGKRTLALFIGSLGHLGNVDHCSFFLLKEKRFMLLELPFRLAFGLCGAALCGI